MVHLGGSGAILAVLMPRFKTYWLLGKNKATSSEPLVSGVLPCVWDLEDTAFG